MWKEQKYIHYLVKIIAILGILGFALIIIYIFSINNEIYSENNISFLYFLIIDISIILIPITLTFLNINKKFTKERNELKDLKASLINIRYESSYRLIEKLDSEEDKKKLLNNIVLRKFKEKFYINPIIINETVHKLRKFNIKPGSQISYADTFGFIIRNEGFGSFKDPILDEIDEYKGTPIGAYCNDRKEYYENYFRPKHVSIIEHKGSPIGAYSVMIKKNGIYIVYLYLLSEYEDSGIKETLIKDILERAKEEHKQVMTCVYKGDDIDRQLCVHLGFEVF